MFCLLDSVEWFRICHIHGDIARHLCVSGSSFKKKLLVLKCVSDSLVLGFVNGAFGAIYMFVMSISLHFGKNPILIILIRLTGNGILRSAHLAHYTDNASAAAIGATGGSVTSIIFSVFIKVTGTGEAPFFKSLGGTILFSTLTGTIGCTILMHNDVDLGPIDVLHATRAGAVGGAVLGLAMAVALLPILLVVSAILISILSALSTGVKWISARWKETWNGRISQYSTCCCYGTCGKDLEIGEEVEAI